MESATRSTGQLTKVELRGRYVIVLLQLSLLALKLLLRKCQLVLAGCLVQTEQGRHLRGSSSRIVIVVIALGFISHHPLPENVLTT